MSQKREKFIELAEKRVTKAIKDLRLIANLANRNNYEYTEQDIQQIVTSLESEIRGLKTRFSVDEGKKASTFKLKV